MTTATEGCPKLGIKLINQEAFAMYYKTVKHTSNPIFYSFHFARNAFVQVSCTLILSVTQSKFLTLVPFFFKLKVIVTIVIYAMNCNKVTVNSTIWSLDTCKLCKSRIHPANLQLAPTPLLCIVVHRSTNFSKMPKHHLYLILQQEGMLREMKMNFVGYNFFAI